MCDEKQKWIEMLGRCFLKSKQGNSVRKTEKSAELQYQSYSMAVKAGKMKKNRRLETIERYGSTEWCYEWKIYIIKEDLSFCQSCFVCMWLPTPI